MACPRTDSIYPITELIVLTLESSVFDLTREDSIALSISEGSTSSSQVPMPVRQRHRTSNERTRVLTDEDENGLWMDKYELATEVRRILSPCEVQSSKLHNKHCVSGFSKRVRVVHQGNVSYTLEVSEAEHIHFLSITNCIAYESPLLVQLIVPLHVLFPEGLALDTELLSDKLQPFLTGATICDSVFEH